MDRVIRAEPRLTGEWRQAVFIGDADAHFSVIEWLEGLGLAVNRGAAIEEVEELAGDDTEIVVCAVPPERLLLLDSWRLQFPEKVVLTVPAQLEGVQARNADFEQAPLNPELTGGERVVGGSRPVRELKEMVARVAASEGCALITGETGTGKELLAELIHVNSERCDKPFVCINCAAIPEALVESELFGFERGAFTGAVARVSGKMLLADGGTLFLDEVGDLTPLAQAKILRAIEGKPVYVLGGQKPVELDVRVIAATNRDLEKDVAEKRFREDLYYRLNILRVQAPPLRSRLDDLPALVKHFIEEFNDRCCGSVTGFARESMELMFRHQWPGNVRELRNVVEAAFAYRRHRGETELRLPEDTQARWTQSEKADGGEKDVILKSLAATGWNRSRTAAALHLSRMTLYRKMQRYGLSSLGANQKAPRKPNASDAALEAEKARTAS